MPGGIVIKDIILRRWCWRSMRFSGMIIPTGQYVSSYGYWHHYHIGDATCMGCGRVHFIRGTRGLIE